jgi:hypothetical protein
MESYGSATMVGDYYISYIAVIQSVAEIQTFKMEGNGYNTGSGLFYRSQTVNGVFS